MIALFVASVAPGASLGIAAAAEERLNAIAEAAKIPRERRIVTPAVDFLCLPAQEPNVRDGSIRHSGAIIFSRGAKTIADDRARDIGAPPRKTAA
jgi:hypothetical protein